MKAILKTALFIICACLLFSFNMVKPVSQPQMTNAPVVRTMQFNPLTFGWFTCNKPANLRSYPSLGTSHLLWNAVSGAADYTYELYYSYFTPGSYMYLVEDGTTGSTSITGTTDLPGYYDWNVKTNCSGGGGSSIWAYGSFYVPF